MVVGIDGDGLPSDPLARVEVAPLADGGTAGRSEPGEPLDEGWALLSLAGGTRGGHGCGVKRDGSVWCWGSNGLLQLGLDYDEVAVRSTVPAQVDPSGWMGLSTGDTRSCGAWIERVEYECPDDHED